MVWVGGSALAIWCLGSGMGSFLPCSEDANTEV